MTPSSMQTEAALQAVHERIERHNALVLPWIQLWRAMGYGPDSIAKLLEAAKVQPPRSKWSANAVRRIADREGINWGSIQGIRSFVPGGRAPGLKRAESASLARSLKDLEAAANERASDARAAASVKAALLKGMSLLSEGRWASAV